MLDLGNKGTSLLHIIFKKCFTVKALAVITSKFLNFTFMNLADFLQPGANAVRLFTAVSYEFL